MEKITAYKTSDKKIFERVEQAENHEISLEYLEDINAYLNSDLNLYKGTPQKSIARTSITNWELWKVQNDK